MAQPGNVRPAHWDPPLVCHLRDELLNVRDHRLELAVHYAPSQLMVWVSKPFGQRVRVSRYG